MKKIMLAAFACSFAGAFAVELFGIPIGPCPGIPTIYACCDGTSQGTAQYCADHGGACERLYVCGIPF
jgi:hypothetical protein